MSRRILFSPEARRDLMEIAAFVARSSEPAADRVVARFQAEIWRLAERPGIGHARQDVKDPELRFWRVWSWLVAYTFDAVELRIVRIVHGHRDFPAVFGGSPPI